MYLCILLCICVFTNAGTYAGCAPVGVNNTNNSGRDEKKGIRLLYKTYSRSEVWLMLMEKKYDENRILYKQNCENYNLEICSQNAEMSSRIALKWTPPLLPPATMYSPKYECK